MRSSFLVNYDDSIIFQLLPVASLHIECDFPVSLSSLQIFVLKQVLIRSQSCDSRYSYLHHTMNMFALYLANKSFHVRLSQYSLEDILSDNLEIVGSNFMYSSRKLENICLPRLRVVDNNFLYKKSILNNFCFL